MLLIKFCYLFRNSFFILLIILFSLNSPKLTFANSNWTKYPLNPILTNGLPNTWDDKFIFAGDVIYINGIYKMWFSGTNSNDGFEQIGLATSTDGINWTKYDNNPVFNIGSASEWDSIAVGEPTVLYENNIYYMWYRGFNGIGENFQIGLATSEDGINWNKNLTNPVFSPSSSGWDNKGVANPEIIKVNDNFLMWYTAISNTSTQPRWKIGYATSEDGINWSRYDGNPVMSVDQSWERNGGDGLGSPSVIYDGTKFQMWYHVSGIGSAESTDGKTWIKNSGNPVVPRGTGSQWDAFYLTNPNVIKDGNDYKMWYSGWSSYSNISIGLATTTDAPTPTFTPINTPTPTNSPTPTNTPTPTIPEKKPIIVVPGFGSSLNGEDLSSCKLSESHEWPPIQKYKSLYYDPLLNELTGSGLKMNKDVYFYSYDWRQTPEILALNFKNYIDNLAADHPDGTKFYLIGHSLGGLVIRSYVQIYPDNIAFKILTAGTPHKGTLMSYPAWENGELSMIDDPFIKGILNLLVVKCQLKSFTLPLSNNFNEINIHAFPQIKSRRQTLQIIAPIINTLLPVFNYLKKNGNIIDYENMSQKNIFLIEHPLSIPLNSPITNTISGINQSTLRFFEVKDANKKEVINGDWIDGKVINKEWSKQGDNTVLVESSEISGINNTEINGDHQAVISSNEAINKIKEFLGIYGANSNISTPQILTQDNILIIASENPTKMKLTGFDYKTDDSEENLIIKINPLPGIYKLNINSETDTNTFLYVMSVNKNEEVKSKIYQIKLKNNKSRDFIMIFNPITGNPLKLIPL